MRKQQALFVVGERVRVKWGTADYDYPDIPLGGWAGTVEETDGSGNVLVRWSEQTLEQINPIYAKRCARDGCEIERCWVCETDLVPDKGEPLRIEPCTRIVTRPLSPRNQDDRLRQLFGLTSDDPLPPVDSESLRHFGEYLAANVELPHPATARGEISFFDSDTREVTIITLDFDDECMIDEHYGLLCQIRHGRRAFVLPLVQLEVASNSVYRQMLRDYQYWFANWS